MLIIIEAPLILILFIQITVETRGNTQSVTIFQKKKTIHNFRLKLKKVICQ